MNIAAQIKKLEFRQLFGLCKVFIGKPLLIFPTIAATKKTIEICDSNFGQGHHEDNPANAFRHALWNFLICERCYNKSKSAEKAMAWSKNITGLHEKLAPNKELARAMDLHNNQIGRKLFEEHLSEKMEIVPVLKEKMRGAIRIGSPQDVQKAKNQLVYIT